MTDCIHGNPGAFIGRGRLVNPSCRPCKEQGMDGLDPNEKVPVHDGSCNDYTGCNAGCQWVPRSRAVYRAGAWRLA